MSTVAFHTLGCKVNHYETEAIWQLFKEADYERVDFETNADVFVINTCTVTNTGDKKVDKSLEEQSEKSRRCRLCYWLLCANIFSRNYGDSWRRCRSRNTR